MTEAPWENDPVISLDQTPVDTAGGGAPAAAPWEKDEIIEGGFDTSRFDMVKESGRGAPRMVGPMQDAAKDLAKTKRRKGRPELSKGAAAGAGYLNWLGMGFADEIVGGIEAGVDYLGGRIPEGQTFTDRWKQSQQDFLDYVDDAYEDHPWAYGLGAAGGIGATSLLPVLRGATGLQTGIKTGAAYGALSGAGDGDGAGLNLGSRAKNAVIGGAAGAVVGGAAGKAGDWISDKITGRAMRELADEASTSAARRDASQFGLDETMSRGQLTGSIDDLAKEDMMRKGGYGEDAARIATEASERQMDAVGRATDTVTERLAGPGRPVIRHPIEAGERLQRSILDTAADAQGQMAAGNSADETLARTAADVIETGVAGGSKRLPTDASDYDLGQVVSQGIQSRQAASAAARDAAYETAAQAQGTIKREGLEGIAERIKENLTVGRQMPVIVNERTPAARDALAYLSDVQNFARPTNKADPLAGTVDPNSVVGITPQGIEQVRKHLVALSQQARTAANRGDATDSFAMRAILDEFDNELERIVRYGMFEGDPKWLDLYKTARAKHAEHRRTYRPDDQLKTAMRDIVERDATPEQVSNYLFGRNRVGDTRLSRDLAEHLKGTLGEKSDEWFAIKQHGWQRLVHGKDGQRQITHDTAQKIAADIDEFLTNRGRSLAETLYDDAERDIMRRYAQNLRNLATSRRTPNEAIDAMISMAERKIQPVEIAKAITGGENVVLNTGTSSRLADTLLDVFGRDSEEVSLVRQAIWRQMTTNPEGKNPKGYGVIANNIAELVNGKGSAAAKKLFSEDELKEMAAFARNLRRMAGNPNARNHSNTAAGLVRWFMENSRRILTGFGAVTGGLDGGVSGFVMGQGAKWVDDAAGAARARRLFSGQRDISVTRGIRAGAEKVGRKATTKALRASGQGAGGTAPILVDRAVPAIAGETEED